MTNPRPRCAGRASKPLDAANRASVQRGGGYAVPHIDVVWVFLRLLMPNDNLSGRYPAGEQSSFRNLTGQPRFDDMNDLEAKR